MKKLEDYEGYWDLHLKLPMKLVKKLDRFCEQYRRDSRAEGIRSLLDIALLCVDNWQKIQSPEIVEELHRQFKEGSIVDDIQKMDRKQFEILYSVFQTEHKTRYGKQESLI
jgi:metal-responsive CopG/Arc/MetJ family transcriptional regulator